MEVTKNSKKELFGCTIMLIALMIIHLFYTNLSSDGQFPSIWIGLMIGSIIGEVKKESREDILRGIFIKCSIPIIMILNYILFRFSIYIPDYMLIFPIFCVYLIIMYNRYFNKYKIIFSVSIICLLFLFFLTDHNIKSNSIIKDSNFRRYIAKQHNVRCKINPDDLEDIEIFIITGTPNINNIKGIEHFKNLKDLYIHDAYKIDDFSPLSKLNKVKRMIIWDMDLDDLESMGELKSLENLRILYSKYGKLQNLRNFPNLKELEIQGIEYMENLNCIKGPKNIKKLDLSYSQISTFEGIEEFEKLEELTLYKISSSDTSQIFELKNFKKVNIHSYRIYKQDEFIQKLKDKGIEVEMK